MSAHGWLPHEPHHGIEIRDGSVDAGREQREVAIIPVEVIAAGTAAAAPHRSQDGHASVHEEARNLGISNRDGGGLSSTAGRPVIEDHDGVGTGWRWP